jgi:hypothetical protein
MKATTSPQDVRLLIADVDGALLTPDKLLTQRARAAVRAVMKAALRSRSRVAVRHEA